jgi:N-acetylmuramoyl-L-alanine amidase
MNIVSKVGIVLAGTGVMLASMTQTAIAARFEQREVDQSRLIALAAPVGQISRQLLILEQISSSRSCWQETGTTVEPLLLNFDFTGICGRSTDSNGYSVRIAGQDLGLQYSLRIQERGGDLVLLAFSNQNRTAPPLEIGRTSGVADGFMRIQLNPGWRMAKRVYQGQVLPHIYLTHDTDLDTLIAQAAEAAGTSTTTTTTTTTATPTSPSSSSTVSTRPTLPNPAPVTTPPINPSPSDRLPSISIPANPTPSTPSASSSSSSSASTQVAVNTVTYRIVVDDTVTATLNQVREVVPDAFRTRVDGRSVIQAGIFRDRTTADRIRQTLSDRNLQARILTVPAGTITTATTPSTSSSSTTVSSRDPIVPPRGTTSSDLPNLSNRRMTVVIDPGHGGRDPGAIGINGLQEKDVVFSISEQLASILENQGVTVVMTRTDDRTLDLAPRVDIAERANATAFVSIHANALSMSRPDVNGVETFYDASSSAGRQLAQSIQSNIINETNMRDRGIKTARFYVITQTSMPSVLVEVGFVTGREDAALLSDAAFRTRMAEAIARGILEYLQGR